MSSIDPNKELFDAVGPPPASAPPPPGDAQGSPRRSPPPARSDTVGSIEAAEEARERAIEGGGGAGGSGGGGTTLHLSVTDPQQVGEGRNAHTYYRIDVRRGAYSDPIASVRRRYSDFQWLFQRLHAERPGSIVPIIPHTQAMQMSKRLSEELVEERRIHLEGFLRRVQVHPELEGAPSLAAFFSPDAEVFEAAKKANPGGGKDDINMDATATEKAKEKVKHFFVKAGVKANVARGVSSLEGTQDDEKMEEVEQYLNSLETHIKSLAKATQYLVNVSKETSTTMHELGQSLFGLHQSYDPESSSDNDEDSPSKGTGLPSIKAISNVFASLSAVNKVKHDEDNVKVGLPVRELEWSIKAARLAVKRRKQTQLTYNTFLQQIKNREAGLEKKNRAMEVHPNPQYMDDQVATAQKSLVQARGSASKALADLETVTARVFREMDRFKREVDGELRKLYVAHARVQVDYSGQLDAEWKKLLPNNGGSGAASARASLSSNGAKEAETLML